MLWVLINQIDGYKPATIFNDAIADVAYLRSIGCIFAPLPNTLLQNAIEVCNVFYRNGNANAAMQTMLAAYAQNQLYSELAIDVTGDTTPDYSDKNAFQSKVVRITGTIAADTEITLPSDLSGEFVFINNATGAESYLTKFTCAGVSFYLAPNQSRKVNFVSGVMYGEGLQVIEYRKIIDLTSIVQNNDSILLKVPDSFLLTVANISGVLDKTGGTTTSSLGTNGSVNDILVAAASPARGSVPKGQDSADWGTLLGTVGYAMFSAATLISYRNAVTVSPVTAGKVAVYMLGRLVGL